MAREKMITRTIEGINVEIMGIDTTNNVVSNASYHFTGTFKNDDEIIERAKADTIDTFIPVKVISTMKTEKLYGMPESVFMQYAKELPPRKVYEQ